MEIANISGRGTTLKLTDREEKDYRDYKDARNSADEKGDHSLKKVVDEKFLSLVSPFLKSIGLNPPKTGYFLRTGSQIEVECQSFQMGDLGVDASKPGRGFRYTSTVVFGVNGQLSVKSSYVQAPRSRTTLDIAGNIINLLYSGSGDGLEVPRILMVNEGDPQVYVTSVGKLNPVLTRLQEVFNSMGNERLGALIQLHYQAEEQDRENKFLADLHRRTYRNLLETLVH